MPPNLVPDHRALDVFAAVMGALYEPAAAKQELEARLARDRAALSDWYKRFGAAIASRNDVSYPEGAPLLAPSVEDELVRIAAPIAADLGLRRRETRPTLCLSHDVDYLEPTLPLRLKSLVARRRWLRFGGGGFIDSLLRLLRLDAEAGAVGCSTVFVANPRPSLRRRPVHTLIDPSYDIDSARLAELLPALRSAKVTLGLHGSFHSLQDGSLARERRELEAAAAMPVVCGRQHWLRLPGEDPFSAVRRAGIEIDSTLGWNGAVGFRGGIARPFPIPVSHGTLVLMPMVLMDGPLFDDLGMKGTEAFAHCRNILEEVRVRGGCVAINWHERAAHPAYAWDGVYADLLDWAKGAGFQFQNMPDAVRSHAHVDL